MAQVQIHLPESVIEALQRAGFSALVQHEGDLFWVRDPYRFGTSFVKDLSTLVNVISVDLEDVIPDPDPPTPTPGPTEDDLAWERLFFETDVMGGMPIVPETAIPQESIILFHLGAVGANPLVTEGKIHVIATTIQVTSRNRTDENIDGQIDGAKFINRLPIAMGTNPRRLPLICTLAWQLREEDPGRSVDALALRQTLVFNQREVITSFVRTTIDTANMYDDSWLIAAFDEVGVSVHRNGNIVLLDDHQLTFDVAQKLWSYHRVFVYKEHRLVQHHASQTIESITLAQLQRGGFFDLVHLVDAGDYSEYSGTPGKLHWFHRYEKGGNAMGLVVVNGTFYLTLIHNDLRYVLCESSPNELKWEQSNGSPAEAVMWELEDCSNPIWDGNLRPLSVTRLRNASIHKYLTFVVTQGNHSPLDVRWMYTDDPTDGNICYLGFPDEYLAYPNVTQI